MILLDLTFLGLTYIIVYVGAIMILFLFVIMMVQIHLLPVNTQMIIQRMILTPTSQAGLNNSQGVAETSSLDDITSSHMDSSSYLFYLSLNSVLVKDINSDHGLVTSDSLSIEGMLSALPQEPRPLT
jgi:NADH:ubiquinone oxidoreductase subunit 6 (subunit J)